MKLDRRLRLLRGQAASPEQAGDHAGERSPKRPHLSERLRRLSTTGRRPVPKREPDESVLATALGATRLVPGAMLIERRFPLSQRQGRYEPGRCISALPILMDMPACDPEDWLFLDTETSGLAGGTGTWAFLAGLARIEGMDLLLRQYLLTRLDAEPDYLASVQADLAPAGLLITYNGKSFDAPLLTTRLRLAGMRCALETWSHLDLLHPVRRAFSRVWPDCRLATVEQRLLGLRRQGDLSGAEAPQAWLAWLRQGEIAPLMGVIEHNRQDLLSLPAMMPALADSLQRPAIMGADSHAVARHWLSRGDEERAFSILADSRERLGDAGLLELARLHRRRGEWREAERIWRSLVEQGQPQSILALAKYLEHNLRDHAQALALVDGLPAGPDREHRRHRLEAKLRIGNRTREQARTYALMNCERLW